MTKVGLAAAMFAIVISGGVHSSLAQNAKGISLCLAACSKSDKPCQDQCAASRRIHESAKACILGCRNEAGSTDLLVNMTKCIGGCLNEVTETQ